MVNHGTESTRILYLITGLTTRNLPVMMWQKGFFPNETPSQCYKSMHLNVALRWDASMNACVTASKLASVKACRFYPTSFNAERDATKEITTALQLGPKDQHYCV